MAVSRTRKSGPLVRGLLIGCLLLCLAGASALAVLWSGGVPGGPRREVQDLELSAAALSDSPWEIHRIVAFGTSLTARNAWPDALAARLSDCFGHPVTVIRIAGIGRGSTWALEQIDRVAAEAPELVLMEFAINDADLADGVSLARSRAQHRTLVAGVRTALPDAKVLQMTMSPAAGMRGLARPGLALYYQMVRDLAAETGTGLADLYPRWQAAPPEIRKAPDGLHPRDDQTAAILLPPVTALIATATGTPCPG